MAGIEFIFDEAGVREILDGEDIQSLMRQAAEGMRSAIESSHKPHEMAIDTYPARPSRRITDGRTLISLTVKDIRAAGWQAKDGILTRAAAAQGLEVKAK